MQRLIRLQPRSGGVVYVNPSLVTSIEDHPDGVCVNLAGDACHVVKDPMQDVFERVTGYTPGGPDAAPSVVEELASIYDALARIGHALHGLNEDGSEKATFGP